MTIIKFKIKMKRFNPMLLIWHVKELWNGNVVSQKDLNEATADPVEDGDTLKEAVLKLQKQIDGLQDKIDELSAEE